jgi:catechol 2,3-dioxygenase-like lactoylglutathione lyase family enzyme
MPTQHENSPAPDFLAHWVVKTARYDQMIAWYCVVFGARVVHEDSRIAFLTWDDEHHRLVLIKVPSLLRFAFPLARFRRKFYGIDHLAMQSQSLERLLTNYERLKRVGITPVIAVLRRPWRHSTRVPSRQLSDGSGYR